ncbi:DUF2784 domain-containing protein [bacterium]|nr:DUF2784 domain-containing protein [bacterium]
MFYRVAADSVVALHLLWIGFIILGAIPGRRWWFVRQLHLASIIFSLMLQIFRWICPLTHLEVWLRQKQAVELGYTGGFIAHYLEKIIYLDADPMDILIGTCIAIAFSVLVYAPWKNSFFER